jgi:hypothetical protein
MGRLANLVGRVKFLEDEEDKALLETSLKTNTINDALAKFVARMKLRSN